MAFLNPSLSGQSVFNLPMIWGGTVTIPSALLWNGGAAINPATQFASVNLSSGYIDITQTAKYRVSMVSFAKCTMAHTSGFGNFTLAAGSNTLFTIQKDYAASSFATNTLPLWGWCNRATATQTLTTPVASANSGYNFEGTIILAAEVNLNRNDSIFLNATLFSGSFTFQFDGYIQIEQIA